MTNTSFPGTNTERIKQIRDVLSDRRKQLDDLAAIEDPNQTALVQSLQDLSDAGATEQRSKDDYAGRYPVELLQNAVDALDEGGTIWFTVTETALLVANTGRVFDANSLEALKRQGASSKTERGGSIGYKGIGFASAFEITDNPQIITKGISIGFSRKRAIQLVEETTGLKRKDLAARNFPYELDEKDLGEDHRIVTGLLANGAVTVVRLPLSNVSATEVVEKLESLINPRLLVLLPKVGKINFTTPTGNRQLSATTTLTSSSEIVEVLDGHTKAHWLKRDGRCDVSELTRNTVSEDWASVAEAKFTIAIPCDPDGTPILATPGIALHSFFPTDATCGFGMLIHADFHLSQNRRHLTDEGVGGEINREIFEAIAASSGELFEAVCAAGWPDLSSLVSNGRQGMGEELFRDIYSAVSILKVVRGLDDSMMTPKETIHWPAALDEPSDRELVARNLHDTSNLPSCNSGGPDARGLFQALGSQVLPIRGLADRLRLLDRSDYEDLLTLLSKQWPSPQYRNFGAARIGVSALGESLRLTDCVLQGHRPLPPGVGLFETRRPAEPANVDFLLKAGVAESRPEDIIPRLLSSSQAEPQEVLSYVAEALNGDKTLASNLQNLKRLRLPSEDGRWVPAEALNFTAEWSKSFEDFETVSRAIGNQNFLAPPGRVPGVSQKLAKDIGVRSELGNDERPSKQGGWWSGAEKNLLRGPCVGNHTRSKNIIGDMLAGLEGLIAQGDEKTLSALCRIVAKRGDGLGAPGQVMCTHGSHKHPETLEFSPGLQEWTLRRSAWIPIVGGGLAKPSEVWATRPVGQNHWPLPVAAVDPQDSKKLGLPDPTDPNPEMLVDALHSLSDLSIDDESVWAAAYWLIEALASLPESDPEVEPLVCSLPALFNRHRTWSDGALLCDFDGGMQLPAIPLLEVPRIGSLSSHLRIGRLRSVCEIEVLEQDPDGSKEHQIDLVQLLVSAARFCSTESHIETAAAIAGLTVFDHKHLVLSVTSGDATAELSSRAFLDWDSMRLHISSDVHGVWLAAATAIADRLALGAEAVGDLQVALLEQGDIGSTDTELAAAEELLSSATAALARPIRASGSADAETTEVNTKETDKSSDLEVDSSVTAGTTPQTIASSLGSQPGTGAGTPQSSERPIHKPPGEPAERTNRTAHIPQTRQPANRKPRKSGYVGAKPVTPGGTRAGNARNLRIDRDGTKVVLKFERDAGRHPVSMDHGNPGYDVESFENGSLARIIEIKSTEGEWDGAGVNMSRRQLEEAVYRGAEYWLYVVELAGSGNDRLHRIQDPYSLINKVNFDDGWQNFAESNSEGSPSETIDDDMLQYLTEEERALYDELLLHAIPEPEIGREVEGVPMVFSWPSQNIAVSPRGSDERLVDWVLFEVGAATVEGLIPHLRSS